MQLVAEHGILNQRIRCYPYLQPQTPVACEVIDKFSQMIKCVEASASGPIGDQSWVYGVAQLSDYCVADNAQSYSAQESVHLTVRAKRGLFDAPVFPQLLEARVANPLSSKQLGLKCQ
ncbi:hypothetical protein NKI59_30860 [Mesorhizobium sp. M0598]|uniref:hypothetical protein n=1 Tax=Mesorhizobium sp. M0598 TaxID=2956968 RepID=UPI00333DC72B